MSTNEARAFCELVFGDVPGDLRIGVSAPGIDGDWRLRPYRSAAGIAYSESSADVYVRTTLVRDDVGRGRGHAGDTRAVVGTWIDLDVRGTPDGRGGVKADGAPTISDALDLVHAIAEPSVLVSSGHGLHAYWLLQERPLRLEADELDDFALLVAGWQQAHRALVPWGIDRTHDLARVLRMPGTRNAKAGPPGVPVQLQVADGPTYAHEELQALVPDAAIEVAQATIELSKSSRTSSSGVQLEAIPDLQAALAQLPGALDEDPHLGALLDTPGPNGDVSAGDHAVACAAIRLGATDQQVHALLLEHRRRCNGKPKPGSYWPRTIAQARSVVDVEPVHEDDAGDRDLRHEHGADGDLDHAHEPEPEPVDDHAPPPLAPFPPIVVETWAEFSAKAGETVECLVDDLIPKGSIALIGAAAKAGKTWLGLALGLSASAGKPFLGHAVTQGPVLYVAMEGHRTGLRIRVGAMARGLGLDPDHGLARLHFVYKPRGLNLLDVKWAAALIEGAQKLGAVLVVLDVLRASAKIRETGEGKDDLRRLVEHLAPLTDDGVTVAPLHHFKKWSRDNSDAPIEERLSGSGDVWGIADAGLFITTPARANPMNVVHAARDMPNVPPFSVTRSGEASGPYGGYTYLDAVRLEVGDALTGATKGIAPEIAEFVRASARGDATPKEICEHFDISEATLRRRRDDLEVLGIEYVTAGKLSHYRPTPTTPPPRMSG